MSYIIKSSSPFVSIKLTTIGRELLSQGRLNFSFWAIGDSEINYNREAIVDANPTDVTLSASSAILRPLDKQPNIKSFILPSNTTNPFQTIDGSVLNVVKAIVNNEATERGFFYSSGGTYVTQSGNTYTPYSVDISNNIIAGTNTLVVPSVANIAIGDLLLLKLSNTSLGNIIDFNNTKAMPNLWYKIQNIVGTTLTLDRNLPDVSSQGTLSQIIIYRGGEVYESIATGNTTAYWDSGTLAFDAASNVTCHDVPVWNMNNVFCEDLAGVTGLSTTKLYEDYTKFGSYRFLGQKNPFLSYLCDSLSATSSTVDCNGTGNSFPDDISKSISIIHFTNNSISSLYGEFLYTDTANGKYLTLNMPDLMYHRRAGGTGSGTTMGMKFVATGITQVIENTDIEFVELFEDSSLIISGSTPQVVGRMYPQLKTVVIHDDEIVAATSYKSNRNWTLPELSATLQGPSGGTSTGVLPVNKTMYLTYALENSGTGLTTSLHCQKYIKITNNTASAKDVAFKINGTDLLPFMRKLESGYDGYGFYAKQFKLVYQIVDEATDRPDPGLWKTYDFTSTAITGGVGETINPKLLEIQVPTTTGFVLDLIKGNASTTYSIIQSLNMAPNTQPQQLQFGDEKIFYGNLTTFIGATIYKTIFDLRINSGTFNSTTNPTRSKDLTTNPPLLKISEVGIYDIDNNLVCIGKLSTPIQLQTGNTIMLELSMDF